MKAQPYKKADDGSFHHCKPEEATHVLIQSPGPMTNRMLPITTKPGGEKTPPSWFWNGDVDKPTFRPSIRSVGGKHKCHSFVTDGKIKFLNDCSHQFAGMTMDLLDVEE